jgi:hypothetical protein
MRLASHDCYCSGVVDQHNAVLPLECALGKGVNKTCDDSFYF